MKMEKALHPTGSRRGVALVMVLWLMTILCALALQISFLCRLRLQATRNSADAVRALFLARAGVERAMADLQGTRDAPETAEDLRESTERPYHDIELGGGSYTLLADPRDSLGDEHEYGISDEAARVNVNTADAAMLRGVPGIDADLAADILLLRKENGPILEVGDLLLIEALDPLVLYGEDQNQNGLLDPNEDDGEESWPPDNGDEELDRGLAGCITCCSAARNITATGEKRVNINSSSADEILKNVPGVSKQQADSIVEHRNKQKFASIAHLLDVMLVAKVEKKASDEEAKSGEERKEETPEAGSTEGPPDSATPAEPGAEEDKPKGEQETETRTTGKKAFDVEAFKSIADSLTISDDEVLKGIININTAPQEVLACLPGVDETLAAQIIARRRAAGFESIGGLLDVRGMTPEKLKGICNLVSARSDVFAVRSFGVVGSTDGEGPHICCCVAALIDRSGKSIRISSWRELH